MSLINRETGIAANSSIADTKDKIIADQQASLYDTAKEIEKLKAVISEKDRAIKAVRIEKSEVERKLAESRAALSESEKETEEYKQKYEYAKDQPVKYEYSDKCNHCRKSVYDKKMAETEQNLKKLKNDTQKYEEMIRDQEKLIQEKSR
ncbi:MAG: hypothetical protein J6N70_14930 [Oribacterium sp.]|nr:hypothetical protein [Oribacterium sp.]